jgi:hypothetical protein
MAAIETAKGKFSNAWVAIYREPGGIVHYGYGNTEDEARTDVFCKALGDALDTNIRQVDVETRETYRMGHHAT